MLECIAVPSSRDHFNLVIIKQAMGLLSFLCENNGEYLKDKGVNTAYSTFQIMTELPRISFEVIGFCFFN